MSKRNAFVFNPAFLSREDLRDLFVARHAERDQILAHVKGAGLSPQHVLLIGDRGMGKTTLLLRVAYSVDEDPSLRKWLPVRFDEEQYNIGELADFWLNCLERIGEETGDRDALETADLLVQENKGPQLEEVSFLRLRQYSKQHDRRLLLLVDNVDLLLTRISKKETHRLREVLQQENWLMLVGASTRPILETFDYESPFYDFFHVITLEPLNLDETLDFLQKLGICYHRETETTALIERRREDLVVLHTLMGGNLRTATLLFSLLQEDPTAETTFLLDRLLDQYTSSFKDLIEALPPQGQRVFDSLARSWDPATAESVAKELRIDRGVASSQLHRLVDRDLAAKISLPQRSIGFQVQDRFFNLWYLMRSGRRQRKRFRALLDFVSLFYRRPTSTEATLDQVIKELQMMKLLDQATLDEAVREYRPLAQDERLEEATLWNARDVTTKAYLLGLCFRGDHREAEIRAARLLKHDSGDLFARTLLAHLLELRGAIEEALGLIEEVKGGNLPAMLSLKCARLSTKLGRSGDTHRFLMPFLQSEELPARETASIAVFVAQKDKSLGWLAQGLFSRAAQRAPGDPTILFAGCEIELALDNPKRALGHLKDLISAARSEIVNEKKSFLSLVLRLSETHPHEVLELLRETRLAEEWLPLEHALSFMAGEADRLETLSPEMRKFTESVLASIQRTDHPVPALDR